MDYINITFKCTINLTTGPYGNFGHKNLCFIYIINIASAILRNVVKPIGLNMSLHVLCTGQTS